MCENTLSVIQRLEDGRGRDGEAASLVVKQLFLDYYVLLIPAKNKNTSTDN